MFHKRHLRLLLRCLESIPTLAKFYSPFITLAFYKNFIFFSFFFFSWKLKVSLGHFPIVLLMGTKYIDVTAISHKHPGGEKQPYWDWTRSTEEGNPDVQGGPQLPVGALSELQANRYLWKLQGVSGTSDVIGKKGKKREKKNKPETKPNIPLSQNASFSLQAFSRRQSLKSLSWFLRMQAPTVYTTSSWTQAGIKWRLSESLETFYSGSDSSQTVTCSPEGEEKV